MSTSWQAPPASATALAAYPFLPPPATVAMPMPLAAAFRQGVVPMAPFGAMLLGPHYHDLMMPAAAPLYLPAPAAASAAAPDATGDHAQCTVSTE